MSSSSPRDARKASAASEDPRPRLAQRRKRQREEARRTILDATEALMLETNGSNFSIRSLGDRSGYSAPTVYHYFGDKDGLIEALLEERVTRLADDLESVLPSGDARADLRARIACLLHRREPGDGIDSRGSSRHRAPAG